MKPMITTYIQLVDFKCTLCMYEKAYIINKQLSLLTPQSNHHKTKETEWNELLLVLNKQTTFSISLILSKKCLSRNSLRKLPLRR